MIKYFFFCEPFLLFFLFLIFILSRFSYVSTMYICVAYNSGSVDWKNSADPFRQNKNGDLTCAVYVQVLELFFFFDSTPILGFSPSPRLLSIAAFATAAVCRKKKEFPLRWKKNFFYIIFCAKKKVEKIYVYIMVNFFFILLFYTISGYEFRKMTLIDFVFLIKKKNVRIEEKKSKNIIQVFFLAKNSPFFNSAFLPLRSRFFLLYRCFIF